MSQQGRGGGGSWGRGGPGRGPPGQQGQGGGSRPPSAGRGRDSSAPGRGRYSGSGSGGGRDSYSGSSGRGFGRSQSASSFGSRGGSSSLNADTARREMEANFAAVCKEALLTREAAAKLPGKTWPLNVQAEMLRNGHLRRPNEGRLGQEVTVLANHFPIHVDRELHVYQYDVAIWRDSASSGPGSMEPPPNPDGGPPLMPPKPLCFEVMGRLAQQRSWPVGCWGYDGQKQIFTQEPYLPPDQAFLPEHETLFSVAMAHSGASDQDRAKAPRFRVKFKRTATLPVGYVLKAHAEGRLEDVLMYQDQIRPSLQAADVILKHSANADPNTVMVGRGVYSKDTAVDIGRGVQAWDGYIPSVAMTQDGPHLVLDVSKIAMAKPESLLTVIAERLRLRARSEAEIHRLLSTRQLTSAEIQDLNRFVHDKALKIEVTHRSTGRLRHIVKAFTPKPASQCMFEKDGARISVADYFRVHQGKALRFPNLPCADVAKPGSDKPNWLPVEFCNVVPDAARRKLDSRDTQEMIRNANAEGGAELRMARILRTMLSKGRFADDPRAKAFKLGVQVNPQDPGSKEPQLMKVPARVLPTPRLEYGRNQHKNPGATGAWDVRDTHFYRPAALQSWAVVCCMQGDNLYDQAGNYLMDEFVGTLKEAMREKGMGVPPTNPPVLYWTDQGHVRELIQQAVWEAQRVYGADKAPMIFIIQNEYGEVYNDAKLVCDTELGVMSQCLVGPKLGLRPGAPPGKLGSKCKGIALKVNTKLGGDNVKLTGTPAIYVPALKDAKSALGVKRVMVLGADVSHPTNLSGDGKGTSSNNPKAPLDDKPSIAAIVASMDLDLTRYTAQIIRQPPLEEAIQGLRQVVFRFLGAWFARHKALPDAIVMCRDGVSEGQFDIVLQQELRAIQEGCYDAGQRAQRPDYHTKVAITFVTVQKRHNTRLFPDPDCGPSWGPADNVPPGLVVDKKICHPLEFDFYLNSHAGLIGTNKPAKYNVLFDQNNFSADSLQLFMYWLCHTFARCTRTVSYCPPAYYAHHAAARARCHLVQTETGWDLRYMHQNLAQTMWFI